MTTYENIIRGLKQKKRYLIFAILLLTNVTWIHSQRTFDTDSTQISYKELTEVAKYVTFKDSATNIFTNYRNELQLKDSIIFTKELRINYKDSTISKLNKINHNNELQVVKTNGLLEISDVMFKEQRRKKWNFGVYGVILGSIIGIVLGISI